MFWPLVHEILISSSKLAAHLFFGGFFVVVVLKLKLSYVLDYKWKSEVLDKICDEWEIPILLFFKVVAYLVISP